MKIGILCEGDYDEKPIKEIIKKIISLIKPAELNSLVFYSHLQGGSIDGSIKEFILTIYDVLQCDIGIFVSDTDKKETKIRKIRSLVAKYAKEVNPMSKYVYAFPDPEFEQWFFSEENSLRKIFKLSSENRIPYDNLKPKERFLKLIKESKTFDVTITKSDIYLKVTTGLDINKLILGDKSFKSFYNSLAKVF